MDKRLSKYIAEQRNERCPDRVLEQVHERIQSTMHPGQHRPQGAPRSLVPWIASTVALGALALSVHSLWNTPLQNGAKTDTASSNNKQVLQETYASIAYLGHTLLQVGQRSGEIIAEETLPPLQSGFTHTKEAINK